MATIPIEVIVQDVESPANPTPTPETNSTETNITVPDTGAGTIGNGSTFSSSSVAGIILPAVLLVLALATVCTLLIHSHTRRGAKASKKEKLATSASATIAVLAATVLIGNLVLPATKAATSDAEVAIEVPDKISIVVNREDDITEATTEATAYITSTSTFGYKALLSMAEGVDTANLYLDGDDTSEYYIAPAEGEVLESNTWGYMLPDEEVYSAVPLAEDATLASKGYNNVVDKETTINYGVKVDKDLPAGMYIGEIEYATGNAIEYMQDFATLSTGEKSSVLSSMLGDKQYQLKDIRDEKQYYISKLADGNVWMTQNLDLDLSTTKELTPSDTDIAENWTPSSTTINFSGTTVEGWVNSNTAPYSANPGDIYYYTSGTTENDIQYNSLTECEAAGHTDCQHYHAGNYYNWSAAVASNDTSGVVEQFSDARGSICPAGWRLPKITGSGTSTTGSEFGSILVIEGIISDPVSSYQDYITGGFSKIRTGPLWLVRSGYAGNNSLTATGASSYYQSSTISNSTNAYYLIFNPTLIRPARNNSRGYGNSVRCITQ